MALIHPNNDEENNLTARETDSYRSDAGAINPAATTTGAPHATGAFDKIGSAADEFVDDDETVVRRNASAFEVNLNDGSDGNVSPLSWLVPLVIVFLLIAGGYAFCSHSAA